MVAILQALAAGAELVIMDEPTASLSDEERQIVFNAIRRLSGQGTAFLYISHFLDEILELTEHVTVIRDGVVVLDDPTVAVNENVLIQAIAGRELLAVERAQIEPPPADAPAVLEVRDLSSSVGSATCRSASPPARSSASPDCWAPAARRSSGPSSATTRRLPAPWPSTAGRSAARRARQLPPGWRTSRRTASARGCTRPALWENISLPTSPACPAAAVRACEERRAAAPASDLGIVTPGVDALPASCPAATRRRSSSPSGLRRHRCGCSTSHRRRRRRAKADLLRSAPRSPPTARRSSSCQRVRGAAVGRDPVLVVAAVASWPSGERETSEEELLCWPTDCSPTPYGARRSAEAHSARRWRLPPSLRLSNAGCRLRPRRPRRVLSVASEAQGRSAYLEPTNVSNILDQTALIGILAITTTIVLISGNFDLSVGRSLRSVPPMTLSLLDDIGFWPALIGASGPARSSASSTAWWSSTSASTPSSSRSGR
jgi:hypothetical protein